MKNYSRIAKSVLAAGAILVFCCAIVCGEQVAGQNEKLIHLDFPENLELKVLIDYVGKRNGINFIYDQNIANARVTLKITEDIPASSLMTLLESALKIKGFSLVPGDVAGMMKIEKALNLVASSTGLEDSDITPDKLRPTEAMTRVVPLRYITTQRAVQLMTPFLSTAMANITPLEEHNMLILTDYAGNIKRLEILLGVIDKPGRPVEISFVDVRHMAANQLSQQLTQLLSAKRTAANPGAGPSARAAAVVQVNEWKNQIVIIGSAEAVDEVRQLAATLDVPLGLETQIYSLNVISPGRLDDIIKKMVGEHEAKRLYRSVSDKRSNLLIVTATDEIHKKIHDIQEKLDQPLADEQSPVRFYKLENSKAGDIIATLENIEGEGGLSDISVDGASADTANGQTDSPADPAGDTDDGSLSVKGARILADESSNTIIIIAKPALQDIYAKLIRRLDVRQPQVLLEATIVTVDTTDDFSLGVEVFQQKDGLDAGRLLNFTHYGLTTKTIEDGMMSTVLNPGTGFNGTLLDSDVANVVINALESDIRAKVVSRPNVLVNDNAQGRLVSESEEPYSSVNASTTVATTSFAGYSSAGTNITITPHISQGDYLKLEYEITLSSFTGDRTESMPPSRQTNTLSSEVTIPDGHTIVVGGLTRENYTEARDGVPFLSRIPLLGYLLSNTSDSSRKSTLYVFIRAVILREDKFEDLKILSRDAAIMAEIDSGFPDSKPVAINLAK